jgi:hypothetical protein
MILSGGDEDLGTLTSVLGTLEELDAPGEVTVDLTAGDEWAIYRLSGDSAAAPAFGDKGLAGLECEVRDPDGQLVPLVTDFGFTTVTLEDDLYVTNFTFDVPKTGAYEVSCDPGPRAATSVHLLVGEKVQLGEIFGFFGRIATGICILLLGLLLAVAVALPVWLSRSRKIGEARRAGRLTG